MYRAEKILGGKEWLGWTHEAAQCSNLIDAVMHNTAASAVQKAKFKTYAPRPDYAPTRHVTAPRERSVKNLDWGSYLDKLL